MDTPESDEVTAHMYRLAQANRFARFCQANGVDPDDVLAGRVTLDLDPICAADGTIQPEPIDIQSVR